jgi:hypothetical protein
MIGFQAARFVSLPLSKLYHERIRRSLLDSIHQATDDLVEPLQVLASLCEFLLAFTGTICKAVVNVGGGPIRDTEAAMAAMIAQVSQTRRKSRS